jgi:precorrin-2 dehydrogenase/sirohydrochlorin ferrochelatase
MLVDQSGLVGEMLMAQLVLNVYMDKMSALVVGGGTIAEHKIRVLLDAGASVRVVAPEVTPEIASLSVSRAISLKRGRYEEGDLNGVSLAVAATDNTRVNHSVAVDSLRRGILITVADQPESGNCSFPAMLRRGDLAVAVSTNGKCPAFASEVRNLLATVISEEFGTMLDCLASEREKLLTEGSSTTYNGTILRSRARELIDEYLDNKERVP